MRRMFKLVASWLVASAVLSFGPARADAGPGDPSKSAEAKPDPKQPAQVKWLVHAIELSTKKSNPFGGRVVLRSTDPQQRSLLSYYWGGKCKGTKLLPSRIALLQEAMEEGYAVEIPAFPIQYNGAVVMCMQSIRVIKQ